MICLVKMILLVGMSGVIKYEWRGGKGSRQRPMSIDKDQFDKSFDKIFTGRKAAGATKNTKAKGKGNDDTAK